ncbi:hypothetical protein EVAR_69370_1 [Eumeta japonica]|uniref:Uncharacterized protein n=1 Tax=Eumeta variegata TaxID=151549 RepID=A0A4C1ZWU1_EUMVA|nr:hypothetical protein EVAR_69370_1 [Eumeta japonica]
MRRPLYTRVGVFERNVKISFSFTPAEERVTQPFTQKSSACAVKFIALGRWGTSGWQRHEINGISNNVTTPQRSEQHLYDRAIENGPESQLKVRPEPKLKLGLGLKEMKDGIVIGMENKNNQQREQDQDQNREKDGDHDLDCVVARYTR